MLGPLSTAVGIGQAGLSPPKCDNPLSDEGTDYGNSLTVRMGKSFWCNFRQVLWCASGLCWKTVWSGISVCKSERVSFKKNTTAVILSNTNIQELFIKYLSCEYQRAVA